MKRFISIIILFTTLLLLLSSCTNFGNDISSVGIDGVSKTYTTVYLYSFKNAAIDENYESTTSDETPTSEGYIYSTEKLKSGDKIRVWKDFKFGVSSSQWLGDRTSGTYAVVDRIVKTYRVSVEEKEDTYIITYYTVYGNDGNDCASKKKNLKELTKHKIEVAKDRVIIEYDV